MAEYTIDKFTYDGNTYKLKSSTLKNLVDGSQTGSVRGTNTIAEGSGYTIGYSAFVEGVGTRASGDVSHAEGVGSVASGSTSHAEGNGTTASGSYSHAEGDSTTASNSESHAEGSQSTASGATSHAEGKGTNATGQYSHAEGYYNTASGLAAHAEGNQTTANHAYQHVFGSYNVADNSTATATNKGNYIEIVGKGTSNSARANARTLDWSGNEVLAGKLTLGAVGVNAMDAATVGQIPSIPTNVSSFTNDAGYITGYTETDPVFISSAAYGITASDISNWNSKQAALVSGTNIKTINSESILGSGDITIQTSSKTTWYGTCDTAASTTEKVVTCSDFTLEAGTIICIYFQNSNTAFNPTLNINGTGAKTITYLGMSKNWKVGENLTFVYDGTYYRFIASNKSVRSYELFTINDSSIYGSSSGNLNLIPESDFGTDYNNVILAGTTSCTIDCSGWEGEFSTNCVASVSAFIYDEDNVTTKGVIVDWEASGTDVIASIASAMNYDIYVQVLLTQCSNV